MHPRTLGARFRALGAEPGFQAPSQVNTSFDSHSGAGLQVESMPSSSQCWGFRSLGFEDLGLRGLQLLTVLGV